MNQRQNGITTPVKPAARSLRQSGAVVLAVLAAGAVIGSPAGARKAPADPGNTAADAGKPAAAPQFDKGAFYGRIVDAATSKPVPNATVAIRDRSGKVIAWSKTDADGRYTIAADTLKTLQLEPSKHRGLLAQMAGTVHKVVTFPGKVAVTTVTTAANVVKQTVVTGAGDTVKSVVASVATGSPAPLAGRLVTNTVAAAKQNVPATVRQQVVNNVLNPGQGKKKDNSLAPGEVQVEVMAPGYKDVAGTDSAYWLEPSGTVNNRPVGPQAWLQEVKLAPAASSAKSEIENTSVVLSDPVMDPAMATPGSTVKITVKLQKPPEPAADLRVFAREKTRGTVVELKPAGNNTFTGDLPLDPKVPIGDTIVSVAALRSEPIDVSFKGRKDDPLLAFAGKVGDLDPAKPFQYDPRVFASQNRIDLKLTILDPKVGTPAPASSAPATPTPATPGTKPAAPAPATPAPATPAPTAKPGTPAPATPAPAAPAPAAPAPAPAAPAPAPAAPATPKS